MSFGLVNIPVGLYPATHDQTLHFHQLEVGTADRIRYKKVNERTGDEVEASDIERALDLGGGEYVVLSDDELDAAAPKKSKTIDIEGFVDLVAVDPIYFRQTYYLAPSSEAATKAYALLREAMADAAKAGIARFVMRNKEYLVAIRPDDEVIALETMYFDDEIRRAADTVPNLSTSAKVSAKERSVAEALIDALTEDWDPSQYHDEYREQVHELAAQHQRGHDTILHDEAEDEGATVIDLFEALQASVKRSSGSASKASASTASSSTASAGKATGGKAPTSKASTTKRRATRASGREGQSSTSSRPKPKAPKPSAKKAASARAKGKKASATKSSARSSRRAS